MADNLMTFDEGQATALGNTIKGKISEIDGTLNSIKSTVETCKDWWKGSTSDAFISNFEKTKKEISKQLSQWLDSYNKLIKETTRAKQEVEKEMANKIKGN